MNVLFFGDLHIGYNSREEGLVEGVRIVFDQAYLGASAHLQAIVFLGDIFHSFSPAPEDYVIFYKILDVIRESGYECPVIIMAGNHDLRPSAEESALEPLYHRARCDPDLRVADCANSVAIPIGEELLCCVGFSWRDYQERIRSIVTSLDHPRITLCLHSDIEGANMQEEGAEISCTPLLSNLPQVERIVLGHIHTPQKFRIGRVPVIYPGSFRALNFADDSERGAYLLTNSQEYFLENPRSARYPTVRVKEETLDSVHLMLASDPTRLRVIYEARANEAVQLADLRRKFKQSNQIKFLIERAEVQKTRSKKEFKVESIQRMVSVARAEWSQGLASNRGSLTEMADQYLHEAAIPERGVEKVEWFRLERLQLKNFRGVGYLELDFPGKFITGVVGEIEGDPRRSNGAGKTTLAKGIRFALYGETDDPSTVNLGDLVKDGQEQAEVSLQLQTNLGEIQIHRIYPRSGASKSSLFMNRQRKAATPKETAWWIDQHFSMSAELFDALVFYGEDRLSLLQARPKDFVARLLSPLDLSLFDRALGAVQARRKEVQTRIVENETLIQRAKGLPSLKVLSEKRQPLLSALSALEKSLKKLEKEQELIDRQNALLADLGRLETRKKSLEDQRKEKMPRKKLTPRVEEKAAQFSQTISRIDALQAMTQRLDQGELRECPYCLAPVQDSVKLLAKVKDLQNDLQTQAERLSDYATLKEMWDDFSHWLRAVHWGQNSLRISKEIEATRKKIKYGVLALVRMERDIEKQENTLSKERDNLLRKIGELDAQILEARKNNSDVRKLTREVGELRDELDRLTVLVDAFGPHGIPSLIGGRLVRLLNEAIAEKIEAADFWQGSEMALSIDYQMVRGREVYGVAASLGGVVRKFETFSSGEREVFNIVFREAYRRVLSEITGISAELTVVDEAMDRMDSHNFEAAIRYWQQYGGQVICISHSPGRHRFPSLLTVRKNQGEVTIEWS